EWKLVMKSYLRIAATNGIVLLALALFSLNFLVPFVHRHVTGEALQAVVVLTISLGAASPFLWAFMAKRPNNQSYKELWLDEKYNRGPLLIIEIFRNVLGILFIGYWVGRLVPTPVALLVTASFTVLVLVIFSRRMQKLYHRFESRFLTN